MSDEPTTRNKKRTRRAILDAARRAIQERGTNAALGAIAEAAGVSKGGLLYHFPSREGLLLAVAQDAVAQLRQSVHSLVDLSENHPGKLLRAYVRALFEESESARAYLDYPGLWGVLSVVPGVPELLREDAAYWRVRFAEDGLHPDRIMFARHAAEGVVASAQWDDGLTVQIRGRSQRAILEFTLSNGPVGLP